MKEKNLQIFSIVGCLLLVFIASNITFSQWQSVGTVTGAGPYPCISVVDESTIFIFGGLSGQPTVFRSTDGGSNFTTLGTTGLGNIELTCGWAVNINLLFAGNGGSVGGSGGNASFYKSTDGGTNWTVIDTTGGTSGYFNGIVFSRTTPMFGIAQSDPPTGFGDPYLIWTSTDGGTTWNKQIPGPPGVSGAMSINNSIMVIDDQFYGFGLLSGPSKIYMTTNGGTGWFVGPLGIPGIYVYGFAFSEDKMRGIAGTGIALPTIARTSDGGVTWSPINTNTGITSSTWYGASCKWIPYTDVCYLAGGSGSNGVIAKSVDGGLTWEAMTTDGMTDIYHMDFYTDGDYIYGYAITGTSGSVLKLDDIIPVELTAFTANTQAGKVYLNWSTATELNNLGFEVERKILSNHNEGEWVRIGFVEGHGTTTEPQEYSYFDNTVETGTYFYRLKQIDFLGTYEYSDEIEVEVNGPLTFSLKQNYPNPFNPSTMIKYSIPETEVVKLSIYSVLGEEVAVLFDGMEEAGFYEISFNASSLPSGVYFYRLIAGNFVETKKMLLLK